MSWWKDAKSPALKTEEAALLTAISRPMARGAALKTVMRADRRTEEMRLAAARTAGSADQLSVQAQRTAEIRQAGRNRAALRQVRK